MGIDSNGNYDSDLGTDKLRKYAAMYGLDRKSGVEIPEAAPQISDEYSIQSAIGQGTNNFTVSQLNRYVTAVANSGTVYDLTLIDKTTDAAGNLIKDYSAEVFYFNSYSKLYFPWNSNGSLYDFNDYVCVQNRHSGNG